MTFEKCSSLKSVELCDGRRIGRDLAVRLLREYAEVALCHILSHQHLVDFLSHYWVKVFSLDKTHRSLARAETLYVGSLSDVLERGLYAILIVGLGYRDFYCGIKLINIVL